MYFPILRGRQFELLALRECINLGILSKQIIPVIEPVKASSTYTKTINAFIEAEHPVAIVRNPQVGSWIKDINKEINSKIKESASQQLKASEVISAWYITPNVHIGINKANSQGIDIKDMLFICTNPDYIQYYEQSIGGKRPLYNLIPDKSDFRRRIRPNRVLCEDHYPKQNRNIDYIAIESEFFSSDHIYYKEDGFEGFSDYTVVGSEYSETGFAPYAVAIHIVYFDDDKTLRIAHFVSDSNDDISDPARKFAEAVEKMVEWNKDMKLNTVGIKALEEAFYSGNYPGLGVVKKHSIMHHLELMSRYLDGEM